jgi:predicted enzyme related to lactoylglutathione lyase
MNAAHRLLLCLIVALPMRTMAAELPPLTDPPSGSYQHGKIVWLDLVTADLAIARRFYGGLFGWTFAELGDGAGAYTMAYKAGYPVSGMVERKELRNKERQARWIGFLSVANVEAAAASVAGKGGRVLIPPRQVPDRGEMAVVADPDDAPFGLINSASGDPADELGPAGDWIWALYQSPDAGSAAAFYQDLGGYEVVEADPVGQAPHFLLVAGGYARGSVVEIPAERSGLRPDWLYFARVENVSESLAQAVALGGKVVMEPRPGVVDGRLAVITDPSGAPLGLMEWDAAGAEAN